MSEKEEGLSLDYLPFYSQLLWVHFGCSFSCIDLIFKAYEFLMLNICCGTEKSKWHFLGGCELDHCNITSKHNCFNIVIWKCWNLTHKIY